MDSNSNTRWDNEDTEDDKASVKSSWSDTTVSTVEETVTKKSTEFRSGATAKGNASKKKAKSKTPSKANAASKCVALESDESTEEKELPLIPSKVKDIPWISATLPRQYKPKSKDRPDPQYQGKWMIFADCQSKNKDGLTKLDLLWFKVKEIVENGELCGAHVSTSCPCTKPPKDAGHGSGTICCVTRDYRDEDDVKLTAKKILDKLSQDYKGHLLYKTNEAKDNGGLALYRYCQGGSFWKWNATKEHVGFVCKNDTRTQIRIEKCMVSTRFVRKFKSAFVHYPREVNGVYVHFCPRKKRGS